VTAEPVPLGGAPLRVEAYADFLAKEYLGDFIRSGGGAVRLVVVGSDEVGRRWHARLAEVARAEGYLLAAVDAAETRVHMIDQLWFAVARQVDWRSLALRVVAAAYDQLGVPADGTDVAVSAVAERHDIDARELARSVRRQLESTLLHDLSLARDFRLALLRLCQAELGTGEVTAAERSAVTGWLVGDKVPLRDLRSASLYARVGRHNARELLVSLAAWLSRGGGPGLVLDLDLARLSVSRRPPVEERVGVYYSKAAVLDAYEVLRQLIDATDVLRGAFVAVALPPELVSDEARGLPAYGALHLRVVDEVRDRRRTNPYAALIRLETRLEAVR
jgi:hypothetical protein